MIVEVDEEVVKNLVTYQVLLTAKAKVANREVVIRPKLLIKSIINNFLINNADRIVKELEELPENDVNEAFIRVLLSQRKKHGKRTLVRPTNSRKK